MLKDKTNKLLGKVLVIDDEEAIRRNFRSSLEDLGYEVAAAANGREAMETLLHTPFDIVLVDLWMPVMTGLEFIAAFKEKYPLTPVVVVSGSGTLQDAVQAIRLGAWDYMAKPVEQADELDLVLQRNLDRARLLAENQRHREHLEELVLQRTRQLQKSEEKFAKAFRANPAAVAITKHSDGTMIDINEALENLLGYPRAEVIGRTTLELNLWADPENREQLLQRLSTERAVRDQEIRFRAKDGRVLVTRFSAEVIELEGEPFLLSVIIDLTGRRKAEDAARQLLVETEQARAALLNILEDQKQVEEALRRSEERLRLALSSTIDGIWDWNVQTNDAFISPRLKEMLGFSEQEIPNRFESFTSRVHPHDLLRAMARIQHQFQTGETKGLELRLQNKAGEYRWFSLRGTTVRNDSGQPIRMVGSVTDITERHQAEEQIQKLNEDLERRVEQRTAELSALNKELESFSYSVSHDLRAPLHNVSGFVDLLRNRAASVLDEQAATYLATITSETKRMGALIDDLLALSKIGRAEMRRLPVNLEALVAEVRASLAMEIQGREIVWKVGVLPVVNADLSLMRQVLANLLGNAVKYTRTRARAEIEIGCAPQSSTDERVFFIRDNGVGFDMKYVNKLFGVFQRLHSARQFEGTGIGLVNVQRIIHRHSGRIWAEAAVDQGATFFFSLPQ